MKRIRTLLYFLQVSFFILPANAAPLSGTKSIGPTGDYASVTAAIADVKTQTLGGALVLELQPTYLSTVETFPLVFSNLTTTAVNTLTLRPQTGATNLLITSADTTAATVDLNGAQFLIIDGRPGGVGSNAGSGGGTASQLTIANTNTSGRALRFINEASGNTLRYTTFRGVNTDPFSGTVVFSTTTGVNGNDDNTLDHCDVRDGASTPANGLYAAGSYGTILQNNSGNTISNCNIFNFYSATVATAGVALTHGNTDWTLIGNSFYQTVSTATTGNFVYAINISNAFASGNNFTVTGNFIGGSKPNAGGAPWTNAGGRAFVGIYFNVDSTVPSSVQGNTITNITWANASGGLEVPGMWSGIYVLGGSVNIGTETGNTIGSGTGTGAILVTTSIDAIGFGIASASRGMTVVANNIIGSISAKGSANSVLASLIGIQVTAGANTVSNNTVGSTTTANSLNAATSSNSTTTNNGQQVTGIISSSITSALITGNTVANLNNNYAGIAATGQIRGIVTSAGMNTISGNTVRNLSTTSANTESTTWQSVVGISQTSVTAGQVVSQNMVHALANTAASANVCVTGIYFTNPNFTNPTSGTNVIAQNLVHSLAISSSSNGSTLNGMELAAGTFTVQNNMVRVGLDANGASTSEAGTVRGIFDNGITAGRNFYHNSVYLGGTQTSGTPSTFALRSGGSGNARTFQNNIFSNARSNSGGTGSHYAACYNGTGVNPVGLTSGGNIFLASGSGGVLGFYNVDCQTLPAWQVATGQDTTSAVADPLYVNPTGTSATLNLHLRPTNPAEGNAILLSDALTTAPAIVIDDFDGQTRNPLTPTDIGADAGDFILSSDFFAPLIYFTPLLSTTSTANRMLSVTITDLVGVAIGGSTPRLYFKKSTDADTFEGPNDLTGNGWKYVTATGSGPYIFTLDYGLLSGSGVSLNDTIQYFVVAQDDANNLGSNSLGATALVNPPVQNVNGHGTVNSFDILTPAVGTHSIGPTGDYRSLTGALTAMQLFGISSPVTLELQSTYVSTVETFPLVFSNLGTTAVNTLTLRPQADATNLLISSADTTAATVDLNGAQFVNIDGRPGGVGSHGGSGGGAASQLTIDNTSTSGAVLRFINEASGNAIRYIMFRGVNTNFSSLIVFGTTTGSNGNDNNILDHCDIRDGASLPRNSIVSIGTTGTTEQNNSGNIISSCNIFNFSTGGVLLYNGNTNWIISDNSFYQTASRVAIGGSIFPIKISSAS